MFEKFCIKNKLYFTNVLCNNVLKVYDSLKGIYAGLDMVLSNPVLGVFCALFSESSYDLPFGYSASKVKNGFLDALRCFDNTKVYFQKVKGADVSSPVVPISTLADMDAAKLRGYSASGYSNYVLAGSVILSSVSNSLVLRQEYSSRSEFLEVLGVDNAIPSLWQDDIETLVVVSITISEVVVLFLQEK